MHASLRPIRSWFTGLCEQRKRCSAATLELLAGSRTVMFSARRPHMQTRGTQPMHNPAPKYHCALKSGADLPLPCRVPAFSADKALPSSTLAPGTVLTRRKSRSLRSSLLYHVPKRPGSSLHPALTVGGCALRCM